MLVVVLVLNTNSNTNINYRGRKGRREGGEGGKEDVILSYKRSLLVHVEPSHSPPLKTFQTNTKKHIKTEKHKTNRKTF